MVPHWLQGCGRSYQQHPPERTTPMSAYSLKNEVEVIVELSAPTSQPSFCRDL